MSKQPSFLRSSGRGRARGAAQAGVGPPRGGPASTTGPPGSTVNPSMIGPVVTAVGGGTVPSSSNDDLIALGARARLPPPKQPFPHPSPPYRAGTPSNAVNNSSNPNLNPGVKRNSSALGPLPGGASSTPISPNSSIPSSLHQDKRLKTMPGQFNEATIQAALEEELATLNSALERDDVPKLTQMTEEALSILRNTFAESDKHSYLTILYMAKKRPQLFLSQKKLCDSFLQILSKDFVHLFKRNPVLPILACNVLHAAFDSLDAPWPLQLVQIYLDDALHERVWVDDDHTALFVENILTAFSPKDDSNEIAQIREQRRHIQLLQQQNQVKEEKQQPPAASTPAHSNGEDEFEDEIIEEEVSGGVLPSSSTPASNNSTSAEEMEVEIPQMPTVPLVRNRFDTVTKEKAKELALGLLQQHLQQLHDNPRNVIKLLTATCSYSKSRSLAAGFLDEWLNSPTAMRFAKELLVKLSASCCESSSEDFATVAEILKLRIKGLNAQLYFDCVSQVLKNNPEYPVLALRHFIHTDLLYAPPKSHPNMKMLGTIFKVIPENPEEKLASILQDITSDILTAPPPPSTQPGANTNLGPTEAKAITLLKSLQRRILKSFKELKYQVDFSKLCIGLMQERNDLLLPNSKLSVAGKSESWIMVLVELVCQAMLLSVPTPAELAAASAVTSSGSNNKEQTPTIFSTLKDFQLRVSQVQKEAMSWCHIVVKKVCDKITTLVYTHTIRKLLFLEPVHAYLSEVNPNPEPTPGSGGGSGQNLDESIESEKEVEKTMHFLAHDIPVKEDTLMHIVLMGIYINELSAADALDILDRLLRRSATFYQRHDASIEVQHPHLIDAVLQLAVYKPPLQVTTTTFAVSAWYWQACVVTVLLSCLNSNYGKRLWEEIPTGKMLLEMLITRSWSYPPFDYSGDHGTTREKIQHNEHILRDKEKKEVLQFETALLQTKYPNLAATIDEQNSSLIHQLILFDLKGPPRPPPLAVQKLLESLDSEFRIGRSLCCCRDPDFLVDIMSRQGPAEAMGWLSNIVENEPDTLDILPLPCVCEIVSSFILKETTFEFKQLPRALSRLLDTIQKASASGNGQDVHQILSFFFQRLIAKSTSAREVGKKSLSILLGAFGGGSQENEQTVASYKSSLVTSLSSYSSEDYRWLQNLNNLLSGLGSSIPISIRSSVISFLFQALGVETQPAAISAYMDYLLKSGADVSVLAMTLSRVLLHRPFIAQQILNDQSILVLSFKIFFGALGTQKNASQTLPTQNGTESEEYEDEVEEMDSSSLPVGPSSTSVSASASSSSAAPTPAAPFSPSFVPTEKAIPIQLAIIDGAIELLSFLPNRSSSVSVNSLRLGLIDQLFVHNKYSLSEKQALGLIKTKDATLFKAGLGGVADSQLVEVLLSLGLSLDCVNAVLSRLNDKDLGGENIPERSLTQLIQNIELYKNGGAIGGDRLLEGLKQKRQQLQASASSSRVIPSELSGIFSLDSFCSTASTTMEIARKDAREARGVHLKSTWSSSEILNVSQKADNLESQLLAALNLLRTNESLLPRVKGVLSHILQHILAISKTDSNVRIPWLAKILLLLKGTHAVDSTTTSQLLGHLSLPSCSSTSPSLAFRWLTQQQGRQHQPLKTDELHLLATNDLVRALRQKGNPWTFLEGENKGFDELLGKMAESESPFVEEVLELFLSHHKPTGRGKGTREGKASLVDSLVDLTTKLSLKRKETVGLFLDWLSILDPELLSSKLRRIIFEHSGSVSSSSLRSYLLSNLLDKGSWGRQKKCFEYLLLTSSSTRTKQKNVGVALDFISAYLQHPRSWAGFITTETEDLVPSLYQFTALSSCRLVNYILEESSDALLESRVELMHYAARHSSENLCAILLHLAEVSTLRGSSVSRDLLLRLYSSFPSVVRSLLQNQSPSSVSLLPSDGQSSISSKSQLDTTLHRLLKLLLEESSYNNGTTDATTGAPRSFEALKSLASSHSTLVLRYMPLLISALQGRAYLDQTEFLERNHHRLFLFVLGIFDSLRPSIFKSDLLRRAMEPYFELIATSSKPYNKIFVPLFSSLFSFLCSYAIEEPAAATDLIQQHQKLFKDAQQTYPEVKKIKSLFKLHTRRNLGTRKTFSSLPSSSSSSSNGVSLSRTLFSFSSSSSSLIHQHSSADIEAVRTQLLRRSSPREVLNGMKAITRLSSKSPALLLADSSSRNSQPLLSAILLLTRDSDAVIRESAYNICLRFVQHSSTFSSSSSSGASSSTLSDTHHHPSSSNTTPSASAFVGYKEGKMAIVRNLIERLSDSEEEVRMTALHFGVDFYPHSIGGLAEDLLLRMFLLGKASAPHLKLILQTNTATLSR